MMEKIKKHGLKVLVLLINLGLVAGGAAYIRNQQDKKKASEAEQANKDSEQEAAQVSIKAQELDQIIEQSASQKTESVAKNPTEVTVQQPKTVTEVVPGGTTTVTTTKSATKPASTKTTKKS